MYLAAKCKVLEEVLLNIINDLVKLGVFDKKMWENKIIWDQQLIESIHDAYNKRNNDCITLLGLSELLTGLGILKPQLSVENEDSNTQSRVEKSRVKKSRVFTPPSVEEVVLYFEENGYSKKAGEKAFKWYNDSDWIDSKGNHVIGWKQKMQSVWFKEENLAQEKTIVNGDTPEFRALFGNGRQPNV